MPELSSDTSLIQSFIILFPSGFSALGGSGFLLSGCFAFAYTSALALAEFAFTLGIFASFHRTVFLRLLVGLVVESEDILVGNAILEVDYRCRINGQTHEAGLEMKMGTGGTSGVAAEGYRLAGLHTLVGLYKEFGKMA